MPGEQRVPGTLHSTFEYLKGAYKEDGLLTRACSEMTRVNGFKMKEGRFIFDIRKKL